MSELTAHQREHRAKEAQRLLNEPLLAEALDKFRAEALFGLETVTATDAEKIRDLQAKAQVAQYIVEHLTSILTENGEHDGGYSPNQEKPA